MDAVAHIVLQQAVYMAAAVEPEWCVEYSPTGLWQDKTGDRTVERSMNDVKPPVLLLCQRDSCAFDCAQNAGGVARGMNDMRKRGQARRRKVYVALRTVRAEKIMVNQSVSAPSGEQYAYAAAPMSQNDANEAAAALVDDLGKCLLDFAARRFRHTAELVVQSLTHEFAERFAENIALPNLFRLLVEAAE